MSDHFPSIFNDVVGPVMRGPSSSHSAAALRIGRMCRDLMGGDPGQVLVRYDKNDALATTHESQGSDMGMMGGLLGFDADDPRLLDLEKHLQQSGIDVGFEITDTGYNLPNLYLLHLRNSNEEVKVAAISTGGGMVELIEINGTRVSIKGDCLTDWRIKSNDHPSVESIRTISPVLPVLSTHHTQVPFSTCRKMLLDNEKEQLPAWKLAIKYESIRGGITEAEIIQKMKQLYGVMRRAVDTGMKGTHYADRIFGAQSVSYKKALEEGKLSGGESLHNMIMYVSAIMEVKSSMGPIVAAPTAGSCGTFPGAVLGVADSLGKSEDEIIRALLAGSLVGLFIAFGATFSAEIGGCQAECGSAGGMAAASLVYLLGGNPGQSMSAASLALQNSLGMICDPIAARVEAPCLGKNIHAAVNALSSANMALAGYDHLIPLDEVIETMDRVGKSLPRELRCTALGGLAITPTARELEKKLKK